MRLLRALLAIVALLVVVAFVLNTNLFAPAMEGKPTLLAHRGVAQTFPPDGIENDTCTAARIRPPEHEFLENTIPSMQAAFAAGADVVEFDVHPTTDGQFAVFHDWTVDCRTNGKGVTREKSLAELKALDIGYGYTADGGATYPFRGKGVGLMPSLDEVLAAFPDKRLLINVKGRDPEEGRKLAARLEQLSKDQQARLAVYGGNEAIATLRDVLPDVRAMSRQSFQNCALTYLGVGWTGIVPASCRNTVLLVTANYAWMAWGWPNRFLARMREAGTEVYAIGPHAGGGLQPASIRHLKLVNCPKAITAASGPIGSRPSHR